MKPPWSVGIQASIIKVGSAMQERRRVVFGLLLAAASIPALSMRAWAQGYPPPPRPYGEDDEEEHRRYEERRHEEYERRRGYYEGHGPGGGRTYALEEQRNERVLHLQQQLARGEIGRRQFDYGVAQIDRELNEQLFNR